MHRGTVVVIPVIDRVVVQRIEMQDEVHHEGWMPELADRANLFVRDVLVQLGEPILVVDDRRSETAACIECPNSSNAPFGELTRHVEYAARRIELDACRITESVVASRCHTRCFGEIAERGR